jgi:putative ABC transport system permease protein
LKETSRISGMLKALVLIWIPAVMAGTMVSGTNPIYATTFEFIFVPLILAASGIAGLVVTLLMRTCVFSAAAQLTLCSGSRANTN